jgi:CRP-like cAMP-binding protein
MLEARSVSHVERVLLLRKTAAVGTLPAAALARVAEYARERSFRPGALLLRDGEPAGALYYVVEGEVGLVRRGRDAGVARAGAGVGELVLLARDPAGLEARARTEVLALELSQESVLEIFDDHFDIFHHVLRETSRQLIRLLRRAPRDTSEAAPTLRGRRIGERELDLVERILYLRQAPPFAQSSINALAELSRSLTEVRFEAGTVLWSEGSSSRVIFLLAEGRVRCRSSQGFALDVGGGNALGALEALGDLPRWYEAVAETPLVTLVADVDTLLDIFEDNMEMGADYLAILAGWTLGIYERLAERGELSQEVVHGASGDASIAAARE